MNEHPRIMKSKNYVNDLGSNYILPFSNLNDFINDEDVTNQLPILIPYFMKENEKNLCQGSDEVRFLLNSPYSKLPKLKFYIFQGIRNTFFHSKAKCHNLHRTNPFLKLGPFKYETLNDVPHIALIREFASYAQTNKIKSEAAGKMRATPLSVNGSVSLYTQFRTSKVMYMNEHVYPISKDLSNSINLALKFNVTSKFGSENYQVMNYGMGGSIVTHLDSVGGVEDESHQVS